MQQLGIIQDDLGIATDYHAALSVLPELYRKLYPSAGAVDDVGIGIARARDGH